MLADFRQAWHKEMTGKTIPQLWENIKLSFADYSD